MEKKKLALAVAMVAAPFAAHGQARNISEPLTVLGGKVEGLALTRLTKNPDDVRLAYELALTTELQFEMSEAAIKALPSNVHQAILALCSDFLFPLVETTNETVGFPKVHGARIMLKAKPVASLFGAAAGTYVTLIFPTERGCLPDW